MIKRLKITFLLLLILCISSMLLLVGCGGDEELTDAYITNSNLPRTTYVEGQELDLSSGYLTVVRGSEESNLPLTAEGVTVSGYDKNTLGEQTVTVSYDTVSTTFTVKVIPRVTAENYETKYFVQDSFNSSKGKLKIANDDAKITTVNLSDSRVSVVSFDTSSAGTKTVTVRYTSGQSNYECQFNVTVYEAAEIKYSAPRKTSYDSHRASVEDSDVKDGYFTVTSADGNLTKIVPITAAMVKGFDSSLATIDNREIPIPQKLTIEYLGNSFDYDINIFFSKISVINYYAGGILKGIDLSGTLSEAQCSAALDAVSELLELSPAEKAMLSEETVNRTVSVAAVGVMQLFADELDECKYAFGMNEKGELGLVGASYQATADALGRLTDDDSELNVYVSILRQLSADYANVNVTPTEKVSDVVIVYSEEMEDLLIPVLTHLVTVHELTCDVNLTNLAEHGTDIINAVYEIKRSEYYKNQLGVFYTDVLSKWREDDDLLEVVYHYFLYVYEGDEDFMKNNLFGYFPMPKEIEDVYTQVMSTYQLQIELYQGYNGDLWLSDLSTFATSYFLTLDFAEIVKSSGDDFLLDIYNKYDMDYIIAYYTGAQNFGFNYHAGPMLNSDIFSDLWSKYYVVLQLYLTGTLDAKNSDHMAVVSNMVDSFLDMNPNEVFGFLSSLYLGYGDSRGSQPVLYLDTDDTQKVNIFATILRDYYSKQLTEKNALLFKDLLMAIEFSALFGENDYVLNEFVTYMNKVIAARKNLTDADDIANFENYLEDSYLRCLDIYARISNEYEGKPTEAELALLAELRADIERYEEIYQYLFGLSSNQYTEAHNILLYSAYAKATVTYGRLTADMSDAARAILFTEGLTLRDSAVTLAKAYHIINVEATMIMMQNTGTFSKDGKLLLISQQDALTDYGMMSIYAKMSDLLYFFLIDETAIPDAGILEALASEIEFLSEFVKKMFNNFGGASAYYSASCEYLKLTHKDNAAVMSAVSTLADVASAYADYRMNSNDAKTKAAFLSAMEELIDNYDSLASEVKTVISGIYGFYCEVYEALNA